jgi:uncharacterized protein (DUF362 family)
MKRHDPSRREFIKTSVGAALGAASASAGITPWSPLAAGVTGPVSTPSPGTEGHVVGIARVMNGDVGRAVEEAIDLLGGIGPATAGKERIMLKPNLVGPDPRCTTKPVVVETLARLMKGAGKEVLVGEGSGGAPGFNLLDGETYRTINREILDPMQKYVFDTLGYTELARSLDLPLVNLHSGEMAEVPLPSGFVFDELTVHRSLTEVDLLCSVPMMKTHMLATVTLSMKNLIGVYPGTVYYSARTWLHDRAAEAGSPGIAYEIVDMVRANRMGLVVIDASTAMEGNGPLEGSIVPMNLIIAGTSPLAADMVGATVMGFDAAEIPTFQVAQQVGLGPASLEEIEIRGVGLQDARRPVVPPTVIPWTSISGVYGVKVLGSRSPSGRMTCPFNRLADPRMG